jgi:hypothetical protein
MRKVDFRCTLCQAPTGLGVSRASWFMGGGGATARGAQHPHLDIGYPERAQRRPAVALRCCVSKLHTTQATGCVRWCSQRPRCRNPLPGGLPGSATCHMHIHRSQIMEYGIWNAATHPLCITHGGRPAAAPTACHSPMDTLANSYRLARPRAHPCCRGAGPWAISISSRYTSR